MRPELPEDLVSLDESTGSNISIRLAESFVQLRTSRFIKPVARRLTLVGGSEREPSCSPAFVSI